MKQNNPFLPGISTQLSGRRPRRQIEAYRRLRNQVLSESICDYAQLFSRILPVQTLAEAQRTARKRCYPEVITFWAWISQLLEENASCNKAVTLVQNWYQEAGLSVPAFNTSSYCRARKRLSNEFLDTVSKASQSFVEARIEAHQLWRGHRLKAIDGTSVRLMDTPENQEQYPQPYGQKPGCGFPVMGLVGILDLTTGYLADYVTCRPQEHDAVGFYRLTETFSRGDIVIGDRAFCSYAMLGHLLEKKGVHSLMRLHQAREKKLDWKRGRKVDRNSRIITWNKPKAATKCGMSQSEWDALPDEMNLRLVRCPGKGRDGKPKTIYLVTTLLDPEDYPTDEIAAVYAERWKIEVKFRDIKTTMGLDGFRVQSPEMALKTLRMMQLCYNLIKALQQEAIRGEAVVMDELGFKGTIDVIVGFRNCFRKLQSKPVLRAAKLYEVEARIAERILRIRPDRSEPRALKLRPNSSYQLLTKPRAEFVEIPHRSQYKKVA